ncbi:MAG: NUDIX hydrolase [Candidatus Spechtbacterales bacterium]
MEQDLPESVKVGLGVFVFDDKNRILFLKRKGAHGGETWGLPGGKLEHGETFEECSRRETREEAGLEIDNLRVAAVTNDVFADTNKHYVTVFTAARATGGEARVCEPEKCSDVRWCAPGEFPDPLFLPLHSLAAVNPLCPCGASAQYKECHGQ